MKVRRNPQPFLINSTRFGKKIAQGQDPLAALANAIKLGSQMTLRNNSRKSFAVGGPGEKQLPPQ